MTDYQWSPALPLAPRIDAQTFGEALERLANADEPPLLVSPRKIVDYARSRRSPIHRLFMWDDARAGERYRWSQARHYVLQLEIVLVEVKGTRAISTRGFWSVTDGKERGYASRYRIMSERDLKLQVIRTARIELESYLNRYTGVLNFGTFIPRVARLVDDMKKEFEKLEAEATKEKARS